MRRAFVVLVSVVFAALLGPAALAGPESQSGQCLLPQNVVACVAGTPDRETAALGATITSWSSGICSGVPGDQLATCVVNWVVGGTAMSIDCWSDSTGTLCDVIHDNGMHEYFFVPA